MPMDAASSTEPEVIDLYVSADHRFEARVKTYREGMVGVKKVGDFSNVDWCLLHICTCAHDALLGGSTAIDIKAIRRYILTTYADEGVDRWKVVFEAALKTFQKELNIPSS
jgi:hypothetical protein